MPWLREKKRIYFKTAGSDFITLSKVKDKYEVYFTVMEASERYNNKECGVEAFVNERERERERERRRAG